MMYLGDKPVGLLTHCPGTVITDTGTLTLSETIHTITVNHNLGMAPDFAYIYMEIDDANKIPYGSCTECSYGRVPYQNKKNMDSQYSMRFDYNYIHPSSGNFLNGAWYAPQPTNEQFYFSRGAEDWPANDINGHPITYRWVVGKVI